VDRKKVFNNVRGYEDIVEAKRAREGGETSANDWEGGTVANNNGGGKRGGR
jgi:hypothetical protein